MLSRRDGQMALCLAPSPKSNHGQGAGVRLVCSSPTHPERDPLFLSDAIDVLPKYCRSGSRSELAILTVLTGGGSCMRGCQTECCYLAATAAVWLCARLDPQLPS